jgi:hypothetical protein
MKLKYSAFVCLFLGSISLFGQDPVAKKYGDLITIADLKENLTILASDALEGRETGTRGQKMAAAFIAAHFQELGLAAPVNGSNYQTVELFRSLPGESYIKAGNVTFKNFESVAYAGSMDSNGEQTLPVVFVGKGGADDYADLSVEGKAALIFVSGEASPRRLAAVAREKGAKMVLVTNADANEAKALLDQYKGYLAGGSISLKQSSSANNSGMFFVTPEVAEKVMGTTLDKLSKSIAADAKKGSLKKIKPGSLTYKTALNVQSVKSENILGFLEGTDKKDEVVVITAHYDHIGTRPTGEGDRINNGADDDGSGTVSVLQLAKAFAQAKKDGKGPRRSILFMTVTGEEKGLLGSEYYSENPIYPLDKTVVNLNIDMVGRRDPQHKDSAPYVYVIGADKLSTELHQLSESTNKTYTNLVFDYTYNDENHPTNLYRRSDHWNFAKKNIPIIFYFDGIHEDYHKPSDEVSKIEFDLLQKRAQCVFFTAWEIVNRDNRIVPDAK